MCSKIGKNFLLVNFFLQEKVSSYKYILGIVPLLLLYTATNPAKVKSRKQAANVFKTNPEGKLVIRDETETEGKRTELGGDQGQDVEEMDVDKVIPLIPVC